MQLQDILDSVAALSSRATTVLDDADKIIAENSPTIHSALANVDQFSKALADNSAGVDAALKSVSELGKQIGPLAARLQTLSDDSDRLVQSIDPEQFARSSATSRRCRRRASRSSIAPTSFLPTIPTAINSTLQNADVFSKALADNAPNVDTTLKNLAEISKTVQPVVAQIQSCRKTPIAWSRRSNRTRSTLFLDNAQTFSQALAESSDNVKALVRDGAVLAGHLNDSANRLDTALIDADSLLKAVDSQKIAGIVDSASDVAQTVRQNRGNIDSTLKNFSEMSAKLNDSADKVDGVLTAAQNFLGAPGTKGAVDRIGEAALSVKKLADDVDSRIKDIASGLSRFTNTGLREYEALAVEARRTVQDIDGVVRSLGRNPSQVIFGSKPVAA